MKLLSFETSILLGAAALVPGIALSQPLNDTGQQRCFNAAGVLTDCAAQPDDGRYGRDASSGKKSLQKAGGGKAGFDFTKIANDGSALPPGTSLGDKTANWACTRDNVTGLTWEIKTTTPTDLRYVGHRYAWFSPIPAFKGSTPYWGEKAISDICQSARLVGGCYTQVYVDAVNKEKLCGFSDWRMPSISELLSLMNYGEKDSLLIDVEYFPETVAGWYWAQPAYALDLTGSAWDVRFDKGLVGVGNMSVSNAVRLVRGKQ